MKMDKKVRAFLEDIAESDVAGCAFWACPGPDVKPVAMATCAHCWWIWDARKLLKKASQ